MNGKDKQHRSLLQSVAPRAMLERGLKAAIQEIPSPYSNEEQAVPGKEKLLRPNSLYFRYKNSLKKILDRMAFLG
jgi:hypothetical protein